MEARLWAAALMRKAMNTHSYTSQAHPIPYLFLAPPVQAQIALTTAGRLLEIFSRQQVHARLLLRFRPETIKAASSGVRQQEHLGIRSNRKLDQ